MVMPVGHHAGQQIRPTQWRVARRGAPEHKSDTPTGACMATITANFRQTGVSDVRLCTGSLRMMRQLIPGAGGAGPLTSITPGSGVTRNTVMRASRGGS